MTDVKYRIVEHDGGWAYRSGQTISETFPTHDEARAAAERAAGEQSLPDETTDILYQDEKGEVHLEEASGDDRPAAEVVERR